MILTCPSCSASYNVPTEAIGVDGRQVRCKKCQHIWFQEGEKKALDDLINLIQSREIEVDDIDFDDGKKKAIPAPQKEKVAFKDKLKPLVAKVSAATQKIVPPAVKNYLFSGAKRSLLSHCASFMVALAIFMVLLFGLVHFRWGISHAIPPMASVYEATGFPLDNYAHLNPEESLTIDRATLQTIGEKREITGNLINLTSQNIKVPPFRVDYMDEQGAVIHESKAVLPIKMIEKELSYAFNIFVTEDVPKDFASVKITFIE